MTSSVHHAHRPWRTAGGDLATRRPSGTAVTEEVYWKQIRPVTQTGAVAMDGIFKRNPGR